MISFGTGYECDNKSNCHNPELIGNDYNAMRVICKQCKHTYVIRKEFHLAPHNRTYSKIFKRDILQPRENLFFKIYPQYLQT